MDRRRYRSEQVRATRASNFATLLSDTLYELHLTHKELAQRLGIPRYTVDSWTRGDDPKIPGEANLAALCILLEGLKSGSGEQLAASVGYTWPLPARPHTPAASSTQPVTRLETSISPAPAPPTTSDMQIDAVEPGLQPKPVGVSLQLSSFVGRQREIDEIRDLLVSTRLLTLTGPGGTGKTRLALQIASEMADSFEDGVHFVELAAISDPGLVAPTLAQALGATETRGVTLLETLRDYLGSKRLLVILDNFEQVVAASPLVSDLLLSAPGLKVLVTSRIPLKLYGEREYHVPPLSLPSTTQLQSRESQSVEAELELQALARYEAVALFLQRARAVKSDFALTLENAAAVVEICRRLDSLPLAIELAAARIKVLPPQAILSRLDRKLSLLTGGARNLPARQQTISNTIAWSYDLLDEGEKHLFRCLAVFVGGCTMAAVGAVCDLDELDALDELASLVDKSLLRQESIAGTEEELRFTMLETIREYGLERLAADARDEADARRRHAEHYLAWVEQAEQHLIGEQQRTWLDRLEAEHGNLRAALSWARASGKTETGLRIAGALGRFWDMRGHWTEGRTWLANLLAGATGESTRLVARALLQAGRLARRQGDYAVAKALLEESLAIFRSHDDQVGAAGALYGLGAVAFNERDYPKARESLSASLRIHRELGDRWGCAEDLSMLGSLETRLDHFAEARSVLEESLALYRQLGDKWGMAGALNNLGIVLSVQTGLYGAARLLYEESLAIFRELGDKRGVALMLNGVGEALRSEGDYRSALRCYEESVSFYREIGDKPGLAMSLHNQGQAILELNEHAAATALFGQSLELYRSMNSPKGIAECVAGLAGAQIAAGQPRSAALLFGKCERLLQELGTDLDPTDRVELNRRMQLAREQLGEEAFAATTGQGRSLSLDEVLALEQWMMDASPGA